MSVKDYLFTAVKGSDGVYYLPIMKLLTIIAMIPSIAISISVIVLLVMVFRRKRLKQGLGHHIKRIVPIFVGAVFLVFALNVAMRICETYGWARNETHGEAYLLADDLGEIERNPERMCTEYSKYRFFLDSGKSADLLRVLIDERDPLTVKAAIDRYREIPSAAISLEYILSVVHLDVVHADDIDASLALFDEYKSDLAAFWPENLYFRSANSIDDDDGMLLEQISKSGGGGGKAAVYMHIISTPENNSEDGSPESRALSLPLMAGLPDDLLPTSLDEITYVIYIKREYKKEASYLGMKSVPGYRETVSVKVLSSPGLREAFDCGEAYGGELPDTISLSEWQTVYTSKPADDEAVGELYRQAVEFVIRNGAE
jgi:hypothetical protein